MTTKTEKRKATLARKKHSKNFDLWKEFYTQKRRIKELEDIVELQKRILALMNAK